MVDTITPKLNGDGTCTFTVSSFSTFVFANAAEVVTEPPVVTPPALPVPEAIVIQASPQTGDSSNMLGWIVMLVVALAACATALLVWRKKRKA